jgi:hypothetical protein
VIATMQQQPDTRQAPEPATTPPLLAPNGMLRCPFPRCGECRPVWDWPRLRTPPEYRHELRPVLRCPRCQRHFAPAGVSE